jgi:hypothetical protein
VQQQDDVEYVPVQFEDCVQFAIQLIFVLEHPISQGAVVAFHYDYVVVAHHPVIIHGGNAIVESKILQAADFSEDIMQDTAFIYAFGEVHLLDGHFSRFFEIGGAAVDDSVGSRVDLLPIAVVV